MAKHREPREPLPDAADHRFGRLTGGIGRFDDEHVEMRPLQRRIEALDPIERVQDSRHWRRAGGAQCFLEAREIPAVAHKRGDDPLERP